MTPRRLRVELAPSAVLAIALCALHAAAALCVLAVLPGMAGVAVAALLALLGMASAWSRALLRAGSSVRALELAGAALEVRLANGACFPAEAAARRYAGRWLVLLPLRRPVRRTILVTRDMTDADSFRRLRIWALWGRLPGAVEQLPT
jgi:hypothetical protein